MSDKGSEPKVSALGADDPFFPREGKSLMWKNVNMSIAGKNDEESKKLLHNIWGEVPKKEITAIMGPSGAGKSSLLNILAGRTRTKGNLTVSADVRLDDFGVDPTDVEVRKQIAFVAQDDSLTATATPRECIRFSAKLRLPRTTTDDELDALTTRMLEALGLTHCADTIVGGALLKGISGGERKRTSVGVELVTKPALVFLDEPTSGLDSYSATQLVDILHKVANAGSSVLFTIHQPSSEIFNAFDHLLLLNKGHVMYNGSVNKIPQYFEARNHPVPPNFNPADWIMDVAQTNPIEQLRSDGFFENDRRFSQLGTSMRMLGAKGAMDDSREGDVDSVGFSTQVRMLFVREWKNTKRDTSALGARFGITLFICTLYGLVFWRTAASSNSDYNDVQGHFGALMIIIINNMFGAAQPVLFAITDSRPVFLREYSTNHYSVGAYFIARLTIEFLETFLQVLLSMLITYWMIGYRANFMIFLAINFSVAFNATAMSVLLGCSVKDSQMGQEVMPLIFIPQLLFAGFFVSTDLLPEFLQWVPYICTMTYAVKLAVVAEFSPCIDNEDDPNSFCQNIFDRVQAEKNDVWWYWLVSVLIFVVIRLLALYALKRKASVFY